MNFENNFENYSNYINDNNQMSDFSNKELYWPKEKFKSFHNNQKCSLNSSLRNNNIHLNKYNSFNNISIYESKKNSNNKFDKKYLNKSNYENDMNYYFSNLGNNNIKSNNHKLINLNIKSKKKNLSRSLSEIQNENFVSNINKSYKDFLTNSRPDIYINLNKSKYFNNNKVKNRFDNQNNYKYYSSIYLINDDISNNKNNSFKNINEIKSLYSESKNQFRDFKEKENKENQFKDNIRKSNKESDNKNLINQNNSIINYSNEFSFDYKPSIEKSINQNKIYKKVKINNIRKQTNKNDSISQRHLSNEKYQSKNYKISSNNISNITNYSSYINNYKNLKDKKNLNLSNPKKNTSTSNSFSIGTTNTFEDKSLNIKNQKFIESVEELHINYVIMLQSTKKLLKYQENINKQLNNNFKQSSVIYIQEEEL